MSATQFRAWMKARGLSISKAAALLGYTPRQIVNLRNGTTPVGRRLELALKGLGDAQK